MKTEVGDKNRIMTKVQHEFAVAQLVEALRYKRGGREFDSRWGHWDYFIDIILPADHCGPGVDSASNRNEY